MSMESRLLEDRCARKAFYKHEADKVIDAVRTKGPHLASLPMGDRLCGIAGTDEILEIVQSGKVGEFVDLLIWGEGCGERELGGARCLVASLVIWNALLPLEPYDSWDSKPIDRSLLVVAESLFSLLVRGMSAGDSQYDNMFIGDETYPGCLGLKGFMGDLEDDWPECLPSWKQAAGGAAFVYYNRVRRLSRERQLEALEIALESFLRFVYEPEEMELLRRRMAKSGIPCTDSYVS